MRLYLRLVDKDGNPPSNEDVLIGPVNNIVMSLFKRLEVRFNGLPVLVIDDDLHYIRYLSNLLDTSECHKKGILTLGGYANDTPKFFDAALWQNEGFLARSEMIGAKVHRIWNKETGIYDVHQTWARASGDPFLFEVDLLAPWFCESNPVPSGVKINISLEKTEPEFYLQVM